MFLNFLFIDFYFIIFFPLSLLHSPPKYFSLPTGWPARLECSRAAPAGAGSCLADRMDEAGSGQAGTAGVVGRGSAWGSPPVTGGQDLIAPGTAVHQGCWPRRDTGESVCSWGVGGWRAQGSRQSLQSVGSAAFPTHRPQDGAAGSNHV